MYGVRKRLGVLLIIAAAAVPLAVVSVAFACGRLATLYVNPTSAPQGAQISGFGRNYNTAPKASPVTVHFGSRNGPILWTGRPDLNGSISPSFAVPNVRSGYYTVMAEQTTPAGTAAPGTPGRAALRIGKPKKGSGSHSAASGPWGADPPRSGSGSGGSGAVITPDMGIIAGLLSGGLLAGGMLLLVSNRRRERQPLRLAS